MDRNEEAAKQRLDEERLAEERRGWMTSVVQAVVGQFTVAERTLIVKIITMTTGRERKLIIPKERG